MVDIGEGLLGNGKLFEGYKQLGEVRRNKINK